MKNVFKTLVLLILTFYIRLNWASAENKLISEPQPPEINLSDNIRAIYFASDFLYNEKKIRYLEDLIKNYDINAIVIDVKDSQIYLNDKMKIIHGRFKKLGIYTIARIVTFQDSKLAKEKPYLAIKMSNGQFWYSGNKRWKRYWVDPASPEVWDYNINIAKKAIDIGFDEIQFDYIRFPTDGPKDKVFPVWNNKTPKIEVLKNFFAKLKIELKNYNPKINLSIDVFGEILNYGEIKGIGQSLEIIQKYFDIISPMAYPSHYRCGEFGYQDPNKEPYGVYFKTLKIGVARLKKLNSRAKIRPWIQAFSIKNIYNCGEKVNYGGKEIRQELQAGYDADIKGWMLWNPKSYFNTDSLNQKEPKNFRALNF